MQSSMEILHRLNDEYNSLNDKLSAIYNIETGEKLSIFGDKLYIDNYFYKEYLLWIQPIVRYITNQDRIQLNEYLKQKLNDYSIKVGTIKNISSIYSQDLQYQKIILNNIKNKTTELQLGLDNIKKTYVNKELNDVINIFNNDINRILN